MIAVRTEVTLRRFDPGARSVPRYDGLRHSVFASFEVGGKDDVESHCKYLRVAAIRPAHQNLLRLAGSGDASILRRRGWWQRGGRTAPCGYKLEVGNASSTALVKLVVEAEITLQGVVSDGPIANAKVQASVGSKSYSVDADAMAAWRWLTLLLW